MSDERLVQPQFTKHADGRVTVDKWTPTMLVAPELLADSFPDVLREEGDLLHVHVANGEAVYKFAPELSGYNANGYRFVEGTIR